MTALRVVQWRISSKLIKSLKYYSKTSQINISWTVRLLVLSKPPDWCKEWLTDIQKFIKIAHLVKKELNIKNKMITKRIMRNWKTKLNIRTINLLDLEILFRIYLAIYKNQIVSTLVKIRNKANKEEWLLTKTQVQQLKTNLETKTKISWTISWVECKKLLLKPGKTPAATQSK